MSDEPALEPQFFRREDESPDPLFYEEPRLLVHIDDAAIVAVGEIYGELLPEGGEFLDLMSSYRSHFPAGLRRARLAGLGLNAVEMRENDQLTEWAVHDVNADPRLPYGDEEFDGAVITVSVQYLTRPVEVFGDVRRVLRPSAPFIVTYSNRMFPTKAVRIWRALDDRERAALIAAYFGRAGGYSEVTVEDRSRRGNDYGDPLYALYARRTASIDTSPGA